MAFSFIIVILGAPLNLMDDRAAYSSLNLSQSLLFLCSPLKQAALWVIQLMDQGITPQRPPVVPAKCCTTSLLAGSTKHSNLPFTWKNISQHA